MDWTLVLAVSGLIILGTISLLSAASHLPGYHGILQRHFLALTIGIGLFMFGFGFNYQIYQDQSRIIYGLVVAMMVAVLVMGSVRRGHRSWFEFSLISFQPMELARIGVILSLASFLAWRGRRITELSTVGGALALVGAVMVLILLQPDFASSLTFFPVLIGMLFCAGAGAEHLAVLVGYGSIAMVFPLAYVLCQVHFPDAAQGTLARLIMETGRMGWTTALVLAGIAVLAAVSWWLALMMRARPRGAYFVVAAAIIIAGLLSGIMVNRQLKGYQRNRFVAFLSPEADILGASYNVRQSVIAIGSGGLLGKGLFSGTQSRLGFLPERHTDFIYAVIGEEMGFLGAVGVLGLYMLMIWRLIGAAKLSRDRYGSLVASGLASMFAFHLALNVGMCLGVVPVAGVPLPLVSYGGSSLAVTLWALGIATNIHSHRYSFL
ncbi:MAG: FtsW/RodA/SpoVE family cell cycle protein [Elusimicrobia bacterium]|nr:FtsW/RodA/SpoVE family cell cycle protein [Elusimicrobiota bacterium]